MHGTTGGRTPLIALGRAALIGLALPVVLAGVAQTPVSPEPAQVQALQDHLSDAEFWGLVTGLSEPGGAFHSDNFTSNEPELPQVAALLTAAVKPGGAYIGVGPEQNFHYMLATRPAIAFIVDIRRQAVMQHLMFKALFEMSTDRADFVSRLFSMARPDGLDLDAPVQRIWQAFPKGAGTDRERYLKNQTLVEERLTKTHGFTLNADDLKSLEYVYGAFFALGPAINYAGYATGLSTANTSFAQLTSAADNAGVLRSFLGTEAGFQFIKEMETKNLVVPIEGDFAGPHAIRAVGEYIRAHRQGVSTFYLSNVEQYLFGQSARPATDLNAGWRSFYENAATLPTTSSSVFIRSWLITTSVRGGPIPPAGPGTPVRANTPPAWLCPMEDFLKAFTEGRVKTYSDAKVCVGSARGR
jgi:hypothetical protein